MLRHYCLILLTPFSQKDVGLGYKSLFLWWSKWAEGVVKTILVLEDEASVMRVLRLVLLGAGYSLIEATCAAQAIQRFRESDGNISLMIADVTPPCSGIGVSLEMKVSIPSLKIVLTSGYPPAMWPDQDAALLSELPADSLKILAKPFMPSGILRIVDDLIGPPAGLSKAVAVG
jgi:CheY-like chemotaxis protein